jgi:hypothetical protein
MTIQHPHPAGKSRSLASLVILLASLLALSACETTGLGGMSGSAEQRAERLARNGQHDDAAGAYIGLATDAAGSERDRLTLLAVEQWLDAGDVNQHGRAVFVQWRC